MFFDDVAESLRLGSASLQPQLQLRVNKEPVLREGSVGLPITMRLHDFTAQSRLHYPLSTVETLSSAN